MLISIKSLRYSLLFLLVLVTHTSVADPVYKEVKNSWFEDFKNTATDKQLYRFLYNMPKGGDLHHHSSGSNLPSWWYELALDKTKNGGYTYFTRTKTALCNGYGQNEFGFSSQLLTFHTISLSNYQKLSECEQGNYKALNKLSKAEIKAWKNSIWLDKPHEGRDEFFQTHWQRLNDLTANPYIAAEMLVKNMKAFSNEGTSLFRSTSSMLTTKAK